MGDVWMFVGLAVAISFVTYIVTDFGARLGRIEGKLNRILDEEAQERQEQARRALEAKIIREGRWAWPLLVLWLLSKVQSVDQRMRLECGVGFRQLRTCRRTRPGQLCARSPPSVLRTGLIRATPLSEDPQSAASRLIARHERSTKIL